MTDQEIKNLARKYAEENPPQTEDEKLKEIGMYLNATEVFEPFLRWLLRDYCIVSREKIKEHYKDYIYLAKKHPKSSERHIAEIVAAEIKDLFPELSEEGGEK